MSDNEDAMIREVIVTTANEDGSTHIAPMGIRSANGLLIVAPFRPSRTLNNLQRSGNAIINCIDDVCIFAGCLTGRRQWPLVAAHKIMGQRLQAALSHIELELDHIDDDVTRPRCYCRPIYEASHASFNGFNRAQAAVLEAVILVSRLDRLPIEKVRAEMQYLQIAVTKTAGKRERQAWDWLQQSIDAFIAARPGVLL